jgi:hypothetical protein
LYNSHDDKQQFQEVACLRRARLSGLATDPS